MENNEMCAFIGKAHEFFLALKKAGFTDELIQEVINSKNNAMAQKMLAAISTKTVVSKNENVQKSTPVLGGAISTSTVLPTTTRFVAKDSFVVNTDKKAKVKISYLDDNFEKWFLDKTEDPFAGSTIFVRRLNKKSVDNPILVELGGQGKAETTLTEISAKMESQPNGESGDLLNNGNANIFYVRDINAILRAVSVLWSGGGWYVCAYSVEDPNLWHADYRVFSNVEQIKKR